MNSPRFYKLIFGIVLLINLSACGVAEFGRLVGVGVKPFTREGTVYRKTFEQDYDTCFNDITTAVDDMQAYVWRGSKVKHFIVAMHFHNQFKNCSATTDVAFFFNELPNGKTEVELSSLNSSLAEFVATELFGEVSEKTIKIIKEVK